MKSAVETRIKAYSLMKELKKKNVPWTELIKKINNKFNVPYHTIYHWHKYENSPFGKRKLEYNREIFYVLGALLGDGCAYYWKKGKIYMVIVSGEKEFINKYSDKLFLCMGKKIKGYPERSKNVWHLKTCNIELYTLLKDVRKNLDFLSNLLEKGNDYENSLQLIEGYFDAEGCVKVIKEPVRKTPKICLDLCSTDYPVLELIKQLLKEHLNIEARYSIQKPFIGRDGSPRKKLYHLRIYKKEYIRKFFEHLSTIKLKPEKVSYVENWLNNGR